MTQRRPIRYQILLIFILLFESPLSHRDHALAPVLGQRTLPTPAGNYLPILELPLAPECLGSLGYPSSNAHEIVHGSDGNLWYICGLYLVRLPVNGQTTAYQMGTRSGSVVLTTGPDNHLWYAQYWHLSSWIGQFNVTTGAISATYATPVQITTGFGGIVAGRDGNIWYTARNNDQEIPGSIVRLAPDGTATSFELLPDVNDYSGLDITSGPDGNLWFTRQATNTIGRITTTGEITEFPVPTLNSGLKSITVGQDGNLWFTELGANQIGRITPTGSIMEFPLPTPESQPWDIVAGPDGNLWFTEAGANQIGRITPTGIVTEYGVPTPDASPRSITVGPDGNLWFTEQSQAKIGKILWRQIRFVFLPMIRN